MGTISVKEKLQNVSQNKIINASTLYKKVRFIENVVAEC